MGSSDLEERCRRLRQLYELPGNPFPYDDIWRLLSTPEGRGHRSEDLIPDLDLYWGTIAGYSSWGVRILEWTVPKFLEARKDLEFGFFERHLLYRPLEPLISKDLTPSLYADLALYERIRNALLDVIDRALGQISQEGSVETRGTGT